MASFTRPFGRPISSIKLDYRKTGFAEGICYLPPTTASKTCGTLLGVELCHCCTKSSVKTSSLRQERHSLKSSVKLPVYTHNSGYNADCMCYGNRFCWFIILDTASVLSSMLLLTQQVVIWVTAISTALFLPFIKSNLCFISLISL